MSNHSIERRPLWQKLAAVAAIGAATLTLVSKEWGNITSYNHGETVPGTYICLEDGARGRDDPSVQLVDGGPTAIAHELDLSDTGTDRLCYPTRGGTARVAEDFYNAANGEWVRVDFGEVHNAIDHGGVIDAMTGLQASPEMTARLGNFVSAFVTEPQHAWVNEATAQPREALPKVKK